MKNGVIVARRRNSISEQEKCARNASDIAVGSIVGWLVLVGVSVTEVVGLGVASVEKSTVPSTVGVLVVSVSAIDGATVDSSMVDGALVLGSLVDGEVVTGALVADWSKEGD
jgi:hypothetical protein